MSAGGFQETLNRIGGMVRGRAVSSESPRGREVTMLKEMSAELQSIRFD